MELGGDGCRAIYPIYWHRDINTSIQFNVRFGKFMQNGIVIEPQPCKHMLAGNGNQE